MKQLTFDLISSELVHLAKVHSNEINAESIQFVTSVVANTQPKDGQNRVQIGTLIVAVLLSIISGQVV
mgnify:CR=1 FL=1